MARYEIGIDGGGSGCRARLYDESGRALGSGGGGPANLLRGDGSAAIEATLEAARAAVTAAGLSESALAECRAGVALAGATAEGRRRYFSRPSPFAETILLTDSHAAALGAHSGRDGGVAILGTGSAACVVRNGAAREIGGWGFMADDLGSGADIGRRALRAALRAFDGPRSGNAPPPPLARAILERFDGDPAAATDWSVTADPGDYGRLAPIVFELDAQGDAEARAILDDAARELGRLVTLCRAHGATRVAPLGSVALRLRGRLDGATQGALTEAEGDGADGAVLALRRGLGWAAAA